MKKIQYDGFELEHFDSASNFREYQVSLISKYIKKEPQWMLDYRLDAYKKFLKKIKILEPEKKLFKILKKSFSSKRVKIKNNTVDKLKNNFDTIIYYDVLEHIKNDLEEVTEASKKLKKNGYLIISVPAYQTFYSEFDKSVGHYKRYNKKDFIKFEKKIN